MNYTMIFTTLPVDLAVIEVGKDKKYNVVASSGSLRDNDGWVELTDLFNSRVLIKGSCVVAFQTD